MLLRRVTLLLSVVALASACGDASSAANTSPPLEVGRLPETVPSDPTTTVAAGSRPSTTLRPDELVGAKATGNRVILIGDSVMASTSRRYSNDMCEALVPLGWQVEVDAETGRFADFGLKVLQKRLDAGWDAAVILLGNNYRENKDQYREQMEEMIQQLSPRPIVLLTVTEFKPSRRDVNDVVRALADEHDNVMVVDWATTTLEDPGLTGGDRLHLSTRGRQALALNVALALGEAPQQPGACLKTSFTDDSSGPVTGTTLHRSGGGSGGGGGGGGGGSNTTSGGGSDTTSPPAATDPAPTDPPPTTVAVTSPATTAATQPAATQPATTPPPNG